MTSRAPSGLGGGDHALPLVERPLLFGRHGTLAGILARPASGPERAPVLLLAGGIIHRVGPSRALVAVARALAASGHPCLRFDLSGIGDSARASEPALQHAAVADIHDAISELLVHSPTAQHVALVGFCSGADNALFMAADEVRVGALVLFDPTVHETSGFRRRELIRRLNSHEAFVNLLSGRAIKRRLASLRDREAAVFPPEHYGLLVSGSAERDAQVRALTERGVPRLWILSRGVMRYCNAAEQVRESLPTGWADGLDTVEWAQHVDHVLSRRDQLRWFARRTARWLAEHSTFR